MSRQSIWVNNQLNDQQTNRTKTRMKLLFAIVAEWNGRKMFTFCVECRMKITMIVNLLTRYHPINWWMCRRWSVYSFFAKLNYERQLYLLRKCDICYIGVLCKVKWCDTLSSLNIDLHAMSLAVENFHYLRLANRINGLDCMVSCAAVVVVGVLQNASSKSDTNSTINGFICFASIYEYRKSWIVFLKSMTAWECVLCFWFENLNVCLFQSSDLIWESRGKGLWIDSSMHFMIYAIDFSPSNSDSCL